MAWLVLLAELVGRYDTRYLGRLGHMVILIIIYLGSLVINLRAPALGPFPTNHMPRETLVVYEDTSISRSFNAHTSKSGSYQKGLINHQMSFSKSSKSLHLNDMWWIEIKIGVAEISAGLDLVERLRLCHFIAVKGDH